MAASNRELEKNDVELEEISSKKSAAKTIDPVHIQPLQEIIATIDNQLYGTDLTKNPGIFRTFLTVLSEGYLDASKIDPTANADIQQKVIAEQLEKSLPKDDDSIFGYASYFWPVTAIKPLCDAFITLWHQLQTQYQKISTDYIVTNNVTIKSLSEFFEATDENHVLGIIDGAKKSLTIDATVSDRKKELFIYLINLFKELTIKRFYAAQLMRTNLNPSQLAAEIESYYELNLIPKKKPADYQQELQNNINTTNTEKFKLRKMSVAAVLKAKNNIEEMIQIIVSGQADKSEKWQQTLKDFETTKKNLDSRYAALKSQYNEFKAKLTAASNHKLYQAADLEQDRKNLTSIVSALKQDHEQYILSVTSFNQEIDSHKASSFELLSDINIHQKTFNQSCENVRNVDLSEYETQISFVNDSIQATLTTLNTLNRWADEKSREVNNLLENIPRKIAACSEIVNELKIKFDSLSEKTDTVSKLQYGTLTSATSYWTGNGAQRWLTFAEQIKKALNEIENAITDYTSQDQQKKSTAKDWQILELHSNKDDFHTDSGQSSIDQHLKRQQQNLLIVDSQIKKICEAITTQGPAIKADLASLYLPDNIEKELDSRISQAKKDVSNVEQYKFSVPKKLDLSGYQVKNLDSLYKKAYANSEQFTEANSVPLRTLRKKPANSHSIALEQPSAKENKGFFKRHWKKIVFTSLLVSVLTIAILSGYGWIPLIAGGLTTLGGTVLGTSIGGVSGATIAAYTVTGTGGLITGAIGGGLAGVNEDLRKTPVQPHQRPASIKNKTEEEVPLLQSQTKMLQEMNKPNLPSLQQMTNVQNFAFSKIGQESDANRAVHAAFQRLINHITNPQQTHNYDPKADLAIYTNYNKQMQQEMKSSAPDNIVPIFQDRKSADMSVTKSGQGQFNPAPKVSNDHPSSEQQPWYWRILGY